MSIVIRLEHLVGEIKAFEANCQAVDHTDTEEAWDLLYLIKDELEAVVKEHIETTRKKKVWTVKEK